MSSVSQIITCATLTRHGGAPTRFHQLWLDNMPQFLVGKAPFFDANSRSSLYQFERDHGLLEYQRAYAKAMEHIHLPYPDIGT